MALMAEHGIFGTKPNCAIFADTQAEPQAVYVWLDWLEEQLSFPVYRVTAGNLRKENLRLRTSKRNGQRYWKVFVPSYTLDGKSKKGQYRRKCTADFKIRPIIKKQRSLVPRDKYLQWKREHKGDRAHPLVESWIGISWDEGHRAKSSREGFEWIKHRWPLLDLGLSREDCIEWMGDHGYPHPPRSACIFCPYHSDEEWTNLTPGEFQEAVAFEKTKQIMAEMCKGAWGVPFLHPSRIPLDQVKFQNNKRDHWGNECEGMCGL